VDYPDFVHPVADDIEKGNTDLGIVICGSGNGAAMTANKHQKIRAALCWTVEISTLSRIHNDANVISIPARFIKAEVALEIVDAFISTPFEGGRHKDRINKIACK
jgi:ribose 5-phosphate isomerase B